MFLILRIPCICSCEILLAACEFGDFPKHDLVYLLCLICHLWAGAVYLVRIKENNFKIRWYLHRKGLAFLPCGMFARSTLSVLCTLSCFRVWRTHICYMYSIRKRKSKSKQFNSISIFMIIACCTSRSVVILKNTRSKLQQQQQLSRSSSGLHLTCVLEDLMHFIVCFL